MCKTNAFVLNLYTFNKYNDTYGFIFDMEMHYSIQARFVYSWCTFDFLIFFLQILINKNSNKYALYFEFHKILFWKLYIAIYLQLQNSIGFKRLAISRRNTQ